jgi:predicted naringenin-chalcone synthase
MSFAILGMGTSLPGTVFDQKEALAIARSLCCRTREHETWLPTMYQGTGIEKRHMVLPRPLVDDVIGDTKLSGSIFLPTGEPDDHGPTTGQRMQVYEQEAPPLAVEAAQIALAEAGLTARELTHLVTVSCTGFFAPGVDSILIRELRLRPTIARTHVGFMGCHGALNGLRVARSFTGSDPKARVLLVAVELCSLHYHYGWDPGRMIANAIFADGAAALVGVPETERTRRAWRVAASGSYVFPNTADAMTWTVGDHGFVMSLSKQVPGLIARNLRPWLEEWLGTLEMKVSDIASWAIHPGGPRILAAAREALGLGPANTIQAEGTFADHGNMSSPTVLFILEWMRRQNAPRPCLAMGFGPGLAVEATLFT